MDEQPDLLLALYKSQLVLTQQLCKVMVSARQHWLSLGVELLADDIDEILAARSELCDAQNWPAVAAMWPNAWWRIQQHGVTVLEGFVRTALTNHTTLVIETQQAVRQWQQAVVQALHLAADTMPLHGFWKTTLAVRGTVPQTASSALPGDTSFTSLRARTDHEHRERAASGG